MYRRILILPCSAAVIAGLCIYKWTRTYEKVPLPIPTQTCWAVKFKFGLLGLPDQRRPSNVVHLKGFLNRHRILIVFFDGSSGAEKDPVLLRLRRDFAAVKKANVIVLGISTAIPQLNRPDGPPDPRRPQEPFPFRLLTDLAPDCRVHHRWGRYDKKKKTPTTGVFLIDRAGRVRWDGEFPLPLSAPKQAIDDLLAGRSAIRI